MKTIAVVIRAREPWRAREALRAAVGLGLRGDRVEVMIESAAVDRSDPALATLSVLGHTVHHNRDALLDLCHRADVVEVWT